MSDLVGKRAIVCGSTQGIGLASARELASRGASVALLARNAEVLRATVETLETGEGQEHAMLVADFSDPATVGTIARDHAASVGGVHILVNNTGGPPGGPLTDATPAALESAFSQHVVCNQLLMQALLTGMKQLQYGRIINVISTSVKQPIPGLGVSNTIRGAVANWAKTLADELGPHGITVNNVLPGFTLTGRLHALIEAKARAEGVPEEKIESAMKSTIPARRFASAEEVAAAVGFLASPAAGYVNGVNLPVDGGRTRSL